jgi:DNA-binding SARP family transcriptional activator
MFQYKVHPPALPRCVDRPRLTRLVRPYPVVVLAAPAGSGKTCLAAQVAAATGGPTAWFLADELDRGQAEIAGQLHSALGIAWADLAAPVATPLDGMVAVSLLGAALQTIAGPGCVVMDDVHLLPAEALDAVLRLVVAALPPGCRLVVCTRGDVPQALVRAQAAGQAVTIGVSELAFDPDECAEVCASTGTGVAVLERTGGWPLAVALLTTVDPHTPAPVAYRHIGELAELALAGLSPAARVLLVVLARVPRFPRHLLMRLGGGYVELEEFGRRHPELLTRDGAWWAPREWLREAMSDVAAEPSLVDRVADVLVALDEDELATQLLVAEARYERALPPLERLVADGLRDGRTAWARSILEAVPMSARTLRLDLAAAALDQLLNVDEGHRTAVAMECRLRELVDRAAADSHRAWLDATALIANHYRMIGDPRMLSVCEEALGDALDRSANELVGRWPADEVPAVAELLRYFGQAMLFAPDACSIARGRRLVATALDLLEGIGRPITSVRAWSSYFEVLLFLRRPEEAIPGVRLAAHRLAELEHNDSAVRLAELATLEFFAGDSHAARATIERTRECADLTGNRIALAPVAAIEVALDVSATSFRAEHDERLQCIAAELLADPCLTRFTALITAEFGITLVRQGELVAARRYLGVAQSVLDESLFAGVTSLRCRRLEGLLLAAEGDVEAGRSALVALRHAALTEGRCALAHLVDSDLAAISSDAANPNGCGPPPRLCIHVLGPQLSVAVNNERIPVPRGYPAKLLALLIASGGTLTVDAAIDELWPDADPDVARNRLHGVLLRLRRGLGFAAGGPISCVDDMVRLEAGPFLEIDSWEFIRLAALAATRPAAAVEAVAGYAGDVLTVQFAYDDPIEAYRSDLRRTFLRLAAALLANPPEGIDAGELAAIARKAARLAPDDEEICLAAAATLTDLGDAVEARHLVEATSCAVEELGIDSAPFRRRAADRLAALS